MKRFFALTLAALTLATSASVSAETPPSVWDRAKQPEIADEYQLHFTVQRILVSGFEDDGPRSMLSPAQLFHEQQKVRALGMLQAAGASTTKNPLLRFDLAAVHYALKHFAEAIEVFKGALRDFPDHPSSHSFQNLFDYAFACASVGEHECEAKLWRQIIVEFASEPERLPTPSLNLAEADMHRFDLKESIEGYNEAFRLSAVYRTNSESPALAQWGLAVALDRAGEIEAATTAAAYAVSLSGRLGISLLRVTGVSYYPDYEATWYEALTHAALAKRALTPKERLSHWLLAERDMKTWVTGGERKKDHWLPIAKARLATYTSERKRAEAAALKAPAVEEEEPQFIPPFIIPGNPSPIAPTPRPKIKPPAPTPKTGDVHL